MANTFFIGDTHFSHKKIIKYEPEHRPFATIEEHDEALIERWNSVVRKQDTVWHLGDVLFSGKAFPLLSRLRGHKKLVMGNHDSDYPIARFAEHFSTIVAYYKFDNCWLSHMPIHADHLRKKKANIHGHLHSKHVSFYDSNDLTYKADPRYVCVSAEQINLTPISYEELKHKHTILESV